MGTLVRRASGNQLAIRLLLAAAIVLAGGVAAGAADAEPTDKDVAQAVEKALRTDESVSPHLIDVSIDDGIITLSGTVSTLFEKEQAIDVTQSVRGVRSIVDRLSVRSVDRSDDEIRKDVVEALRSDPATDVDDIDVEVEDAKVTLRGRADSQSEALLIEQVARDVKGVEAVESRLEARRPPRESDAAIKAQMQHRLGADPYIDEDRIEVMVDDGQITLAGSVGSLAERAYVLRYARLAGRGVNYDDLEVKPWQDAPMRRDAGMPRRTDAETEKAIRDAFEADPRISGFDIGVNAGNGVVTLMGTVDNLKARRAAERTARLTTSVWQVENRIKVRPQTSETDAAIAGNVREALERDSVLERFEIRVVVRNGKAYLMGSVDSAHEKRRAEDVVSRVAGVASVHNNLVVHPHRPMRLTSDAEIREEIEDEFAWSPFVDGDDLMVRVDEGTVELAGTVETWHEYLEAVENAFEGGAVSVSSYMRVEEWDKVFDRYWESPPTEVWPL